MATCTSTARGLNAVLRYEGTTGKFIDMFATGDSSDPNDLINQDSTGLTFGQDASWCLRGRAGTAAAIGLVFGPDGNLYVASHGPNPVLRYDGVTGVLIDIL
jgi:hypothetical protein